MQRSQATLSRVLFCSTSVLRTSRQSALRCISTGRAEEHQDEAKFSSSKSKSTIFIQIGSAGLLVSGIGFIWYQRWKNRRKSDQPAFSLQLNAGSGTSKEKNSEENPKISIRERRYKQFASIYFKGEPYMTPRDFLESVTINKPRSKQKLTHHYQMAI